MRRWLKRLVILVLVLGAGYAAYLPVAAKMREQSKPKWRTAKVTQGRIVYDVRATGTIEPVLKVSIGSFVSGPITDLYADFNQEVQQGDLLARIDPRLFDAAVARDQASLDTRRADVQRATALYKQSVRNEQRAVALRDENEDFISPREMDSYHFERMSLEAQLRVAKAAVKQAESALETSQANLAYTEIRSPVDGMVINRLINQGQTLAAQFQTPELFQVVPDMEKKMHVIATIDEADVGSILQAKENGLPVEFKVSAYPDDAFEGEIEQIRKNATTTENVVTYPVVVAAANPELKLLPGMTAQLSFQVDERDDAIRIPNAALRFYPPNKSLVREQDRKLLDGAEDEEDKDLDDAHLTEAERAELLDKRSRRHVWVQDGEFLRAAPVKIGLSNWKYTELVEGDLKIGDELIIGQQTGEQP